MKIRGVIVPMLTPFTEDGRIDERGVEALTEFLVARRIAGLFPLGTTGEGPLLSAEERRQVAAWVVRYAAGRAPVIIHSGAITTAETVDLTRHARDIGADAAAIVPPYFYKLSEKALFEHYAAVASAAPDFPVYLYHNPGVTPNHLTADLVSRLAQSFPNIAGLKDSSGSLATLFASRALQGGAFNTASGPDGLILAAQAIGVDACVSGNANYAPELVVGIYEAAAQGDLTTARLLQTQLDEARRILGDGADLSLFKAMCTRRGVPLGGVRAPLRQASPERIEACWQALLAAGIPLDRSSMVTG
ncbi:MAG: dihydrodipicolinate synthase family protein [Anaerolineae bacterium]|nr:dihydrodipicolinate synthase family protein [Anaerolineae bacterium]